MESVLQGSPYCTFRLYMSSAFCPTCPNPTWIPPNLESHLVSMPQSVQILQLRGPVESRGASRESKPKASRPAESLFQAGAVLVRIPSGHHSGHPAHWTLGGVVRNGTVASASHRAKEGSGRGEGMLVRKLTEVRTTVQYCTISTVQ